jgi:hypothetical protein
MDWYGRGWDEKLVLVLEVNVVVEKNVLPASHGEDD